MNNQSNKIIDNNLAKLLNKSYDYGFSTNIEKDVIKKGLNEKTVNLIFFYSVVRWARWLGWLSLIFS